MPGITKGVFTEVKKLLVTEYQGPRLPLEVQKKRMMNVIANELTPLQREMVTSYFFEEKTMAQIAEERGVNRSTVCRTLHRGISRIQKYLKY